LILLIRGNLKASMTGLMETKMSTVISKAVGFPEEGLMVAVYDYRKVVVKERKLKN
jgi:hypothetical protein